MHRTYPHVTLDDKYELETGRVFLTGVQALVRLTLMQRQRDAIAGLNTGGFISGYRGSPLGGLDKQFWGAQKLLERNHIYFEGGVNEDLAATAVWGSQQAPLLNGCRFDGVFGMWFGKGPGVDRCGDVFKHANAEGTPPFGGVLAVAGDDHVCKSSTLPHQSEYAFMDAMIPVLNPSGVQEILEFGLIGWALSRFSGLWVGFKTIAETADSSVSVHVTPDLVNIRIPQDYEVPPGGLNIRIPADPMAKEDLLHRHRMYAAMAFARANGLNKLIIDSPRPRIGIVTTGKSYLDVRQALDDLGIDEKQASEIGLRVLKVGMTWPLDSELSRSFAHGLDEVLVVEEKRAVIENQLKEQLYNWESSHRPRIVGKFDEQQNWILPSSGELTPARIARIIAQRVERFHQSDEMTQRLRFLNEKEKSLAKTRDVIARTPYFCSGCPHNISTVVPEGSEAGAGIGCHYMVTWMDRNTHTFTHMGGEGANWIGRAPFTDQDHIFQNLGDGTYFHSGHLAIRAAVAAGVNITYKILYNDAVAMTGGQPVDGSLSVADMAHQVRSEGVKKISLVSDEPEKYSDPASFPSGVTFHHRDQLDLVQRDLRQTKGTTVLIYDQTCATEKRRRRKRGQLEDPDQRLFIDQSVCEGCGDCSTKSNCLSVIPVETELGRKRAIDQSACNKDYSCLKGFCPSFVTVRGGRLRKPQNLKEKSWPPPPLPSVSCITGTYNIVVTGVGGTGVVTIGAILGMAAHIDGRGCSVLDMTGLAQKYGAVTSHIRIAKSPQDLASVRIAAGGAQLLLGCDLVVAAGYDSLSKLDPEQSCAVINEHESPTADLVRAPDAVFPGKQLRGAIADSVSENNLYYVNATRLARTLLGDTIASNLFMVGYAWQLGRIPISLEAIEQAIELNAIAIDLNKQAFALGRIAISNPEFLKSSADQRHTPEPSGNLKDLADYRARILRDYQNPAYADRYLTLVNRAAKAEANLTPGRQGFSAAVARSYFKLMAYKDEYEIARLFTEKSFTDRLNKEFEGNYRIAFNLAPTWMGHRDKSTGELKKTEFGPWILRAFRLLKKLRWIRATAFDPFSYSNERKLERRLIVEFERSIENILNNLTQENHDVAVAIAELPQTIRGFGHIKQACADQALATEQQLLKAFNDPSMHQTAA